MSMLTNEWEPSLKLQHFIQLRVYLEPIRFSDQSMALMETMAEVSNDNIEHSTDYKQFSNGITLLMTQTILLAPMADE